LRSRDRPLYADGIQCRARGHRGVPCLGGAPRVVAAAPPGCRMTHSPEWLLPAASEAAGRIDALFFSLLALTGVVAVAVGLLAVVFCVKYRRGSLADRSNPPAEFKPLEIAWSTIPLAIFVGFFIWGA